MFKDFTNVNQCFPGGIHMELVKKLEILSAAAKYDVSCSSSGSKRKNTPDGIGNGHVAGICHSWADDGRCISLLKILLTNNCAFDCAYCINRSSNDVQRAAFTPDEVANLTMDFYMRNYIEGLFLSSAVLQSPNHTMELMIKAVKKLRMEYRFNGYIHMKAIPGADRELINEAGLLVDRMSVNIELPSSESLRLLAPQKSKDSIIKPMGQISNSILAIGEERKIFKGTQKFVPAGQTTQLIVGATPETDRTILKLSEGLYNKFSLKRVYFSAYVPIVAHPLLPVLAAPPLLREHRLYQADWLLRFYGFTANEILTEENPDFDPNLDPKCFWALCNLDLFPIEVNKADYFMLLRVPGIGVKSARKIVSARRVGILRHEDLKKLGVVLKRAKYFITCNGKYEGNYKFLPENIKLSILSDGKKNDRFEQLSIFDMTTKLPTIEDQLISASGQL